MHPKFDVVTVDYALAELHMGIKIHIIKEIYYIHSINYRQFENIDICRLKYFT